MLRVGFAIADIDECALPTGGHICSYRCVNIPGSFQCSCPPSGYRLAPNGRNCQGECGGAPRVAQAVLGAPRCWGSEARQSLVRGSASLTQGPHYRWGALGKGRGGGGLRAPRSLTPTPPSTPVFRGSEPSFPALGIPAGPGTGLTAVRKMPAREEMGGLCPEDQCCWFSRSLSSNKPLL